MGSELKPKPCPFCGCQASAVETARYWLRCDGCGAEGPNAETEAEAVAAWNRRSEPRGDSSLAPEGAPQLASGGNRDPEPSSAAGAWVTVPREPTEAMYAAGWDIANRVGPNALGVITDTTCAAIYRALIASAPKAEVEGWRPIESAPRDGMHILVGRFGPGAGVGFGNSGPMTEHGYRAEQPWMDVAHWYRWPEGGDEPGFYSSSWGGDQEKPFRGVTHWRPLLAPPPTRDGPDKPVEGEVG